MSDPVSASVGIKVLAAMGVTVAAEATVQVLQTPEKLIPWIGVPPSVLFAALVGALIGVLLLPNMQADRLIPETEERGTRFILLVLTKTGLLGAAVLAHAVVGAWVLLAIGQFIPALIGPAMLPFAGLSGLVIRPMLPKYLSWLEAFTARWGSK